MVEDVVDLPPKLKFSPFTKLDFLEQRDVVVEDRRLTNKVALQIADNSLR